MGVLHRGRLWVLIVFLLRIQVYSERCISTDNGAQPFLSFTETPTQQVEMSDQGLRPLYKFAHSFLESVQPNPFPEDIVSKILKNEQQNISQLVHYEAGYLVCLILAVLYLLLMPIAGAVLAWRHFHGKKAETNTQSSKLSSRFHQDIGVAVCLSLTTLLLLVAVFLAFSVNSKVRGNMSPSLTQLDTNLRSVEESLKSIPRKMQVVMEQYSIPKAEISTAIYGANVTIGANIVSSVIFEVNKALTQLSVSVGEAISSIENLQTVRTTKLKLQARQRNMQRDLQGLQRRLQSLKSCSSCDIPDPSNLETDADYTLIPRIEDILYKMPPTSDLEGLVREGNSSFNSIPQLCSDQMAPTMTALLLELNRNQESLNNSSRSFPSMQSLTEGASELRAAVRRYSGSVDYYDYVRWAVAVTFCTIMLVVVLLMVAAVCLSLPVLFNPTIYDTLPHVCLEHTAISLFRASVVLSLAFSWLFVILVFVMLFFGGNIHALGCRSWTNGQLFKFLDHEDIFKGFNDSILSNATQINPSISKIYQGCERGESLFHSMDMNQLFDLEDFLNSTKYFTGFRNAAQNMSINVNDLKLIPDKGKQGLVTFSKIGLEGIDYDNLLLLLSRPVVKRDLAALANELDEKAGLPANTKIKEDLKYEAATSRGLDGTVGQQMTDAGSMSTSLNALRNISKTYMVNVNKTLESFSKAEVALYTNVPLIVSNMSKCILERSEHYLLHYLGWARQVILNEVLSCHWLAVSLDNVYMAVCVNVLDPWNAFWLCLGWCCAFLVPGVIFSLYVVRRLRPTPPSCTGKDTFNLPAKSTEKTKSNIYLTLKKIHDMNICDKKI
ncbi:prominin-2-like isoform X1 [Osmerus eperlanus]|uniref:prominin-2-like isoform X1 n=2 Tax=Osmerus eperlanus TaxID=29151 RepID=UPI002E0EAC57